MIFTMMRISCLPMARNSVDVTLMSDECSTQLRKAVLATHLMNLVILLFPALATGGKGKGKGGRGDKKQSTSSSTKAGLQFPVGRIGRYLRQGKFATRMGAGAPVYPRWPYGMFLWRYSRHSALHI